MNAGERVERRELSGTVGGNTNWYSHYGEQYGMYAESLQSCLTLHDPMDCSPPDSSVHGISQARTLEWVAISFSGDLPDPGIEPMSLMSPASASEFITTSATLEAQNNMEVPEKIKNNTCPLRWPTLSLWSVLPSVFE